MSIFIIANDALTEALTFLSASEAQGTITVSKRWKKSVDAALGRPIRESTSRAVIESHGAEAADRRIRAQFPSMIVAALGAKFRRLPIYHLPLPPDLVFQGGAHFVPETILEAYNANHLLHAISIVNRRGVLGAIGIGNINGIAMLYYKIEFYREPRRFASLLPIKSFGIFIEVIARPDNSIYFREDNPFFPHGRWWARGSGPLSMYPYYLTPHHFQTLTELVVNQRALVWNPDNRNLDLSDRAIDVPGAFWYPRKSLCRRITDFVVNLFYKKELKFRLARA